MMHVNSIGAAHLRVGLPLNYTFCPDQVSNCEKNMMETLLVAIQLPRTNLGGSVTFCGQRQGFGLYIVANLALSHSTYQVS